MNKKININNLLVLALSAVISVACAGPSTPFGSVDTLTPRSKKLVQEYDAPTFTGSLEDTEIYKLVEASEPEDLFSSYKTEKDSNEIICNETRHLLRSPASTSKKTMLASAQPEEQQKIKLLPERQVLHRSSDLVVELEGQEGISLDSKLKIIYNGIDSTQKFLKRATVEYDTSNKDVNIVRLRFDKLRLPYDRANHIKVIYEKKGQRHIAQFLPPKCNLLDRSKIISTDRYKVPEEYLTAIYKSADYDEVNPSMVAAIIAQESAFNPKAVSWAKAIGLTQVTPLAEEQVMSQFKYFPQYPELNNKSVAEIKALIATGEVNKKNEWRLHPRLSIAGGSKYLKYVGDYWQRPKNYDVLLQLDGDINTLLSHVVLASYNSGPARVKRAILENKENWILDKKLTEAHKYVNRVSSFCFHFSAPNGVASL